MGFWSTITSPIKAVVGGVTGGLFGKPGQQGPANMETVLQQYEALKGKQYSINPSAFKFNAEAQAEASKNQRSLVEALQKRAAGTAPSAAEMQLQRGADESVRMIQGQLAGQRGVSPAMLARLGAQAQAAQTAQLNQDAAILRAKEQSDAEAALASALAQQRAQDLELAKAQLAAGTQFETLQAGQYQDLLGLLLRGEQGRLASNAAAQGQLFGGLLQAGGAVGAAFASDKKLKKDVESGDAAVEKLLDALEAKKFVYKDDPSQMPRLGIMAQDLEQSAFGNTMVDESSGAKTVNMADAISAMLAASANLNKRLKKLEK